MSVARSDPVRHRHAAVLISDVHLDASAPRTAAAFLDFLGRHGRDTRALYMLGDLFDAWPGDDAASLPFNATIVSALRAVSESGTTVWWMAGNRDFLLGPGFAMAARLTILPDPSVMEIGGLRVVLAHGDAQCTDDIGYQAFRMQVRNPAWQKEFLARPLAERLHLIAGMREGSRQAQRGKTAEIMDVNASAVTRLFDASAATRMIHGHTHRPAVHHTHGPDGTPRTRHVLSDWDFDGATPRGGGLAIEEDGSIVPLSL